MTHCANCGASLHGRFCHGCGQKAGHLEVGVRHFAHEALHEFLHLDGKIFQTLKRLVFKPGELTVEYLRGRRARYISPVRVYLTCSVLFFALAAMVPSAAVQYSPNDREEASEEVLRQGAEAFRRVSDRFVHDMPKAMFVLMPIFALLTWAFYRRAQPYYIPHLYYALHVHAFAFLMLALKMAGNLAGRVPGNIADLAGLLIVPYHYLALRRVFGGTRLQTAWKGTAIGLLYVTILLALLAGLLALALRSSGGTALHLP